VLDERGAEENLRAGFPADRKPYTTRYYYEDEATSKKTTTTTILQTTSP